MEKAIYQMRLHECITVSNSTTVTRVPGGWIYRFWDFEKNMEVPGGVFVPFDNEFYPKEAHNEHG